MLQKFLVVFVLFCGLGVTHSLLRADTIVVEQSNIQARAAEEVTTDETVGFFESTNTDAVIISNPKEQKEVTNSDLETRTEPEQKVPENTKEVRTVPFYSQFTDISSPSWQKVGCGIASLAMLVDYYKPAVSPDVLLDQGIAAHAYLSDAGWTHAGLIGISQKYGLDGESVSLSGMSAENAFAELRKVLQDGPVMASVYYTMTPGHPIPHLIVVNDVKDGLVYYNDPANPDSGSTITIKKFKPAWKQRYIAIRPTS